MSFHFLSINCLHCLKILICTVYFLLFSHKCEEVIIWYNVTVNASYCYVKLTSLMFTQWGSEYGSTDKQHNWLEEVKCRYVKYILAHEGNVKLIEQSLSPHLLHVSNFTWFCVWQGEWIEKAWLSKIENRFSDLLSLARTITWGHLGPLQR